MNKIILEAYKRVLEPHYKHNSVVFFLMSINKRVNPDFTRQFEFNYPLSTFQLSDYYIKKHKIIGKSTVY